MTPAITFLSKNSIQHSVLQYQHDPSVESYGDEAVALLGLEADRVFKTLIVELDNQQFVVVIVPVAAQANLKAVASAFKQKKAKLAPQDVAARRTGYQVGGISPIAQKQLLPTVIDSSAEHQQTIFVSGGRRGVEIEISPLDLSMICKAEFAKIATHN